LPQATSAVTGFEKKADSKQTQLWPTKT
jgi:hypothetical protein